MLICSRTVKLPSEKQMAANKRIAAKSTGPRTIRGKARSRLNAFRHVKIIHIR